MKDYQGFIIHHEVTSGEQAKKIASTLRNKLQIEFYCSSDKDSTPKNERDGRAYRRKVLENSKVAFLLFDSLSDINTDLANEYMQEIDHFLSKNKTMYYFCNHNSKSAFSNFLKSYFNSTAPSYVVCDSMDEVINEAVEKVKNEIDKGVLTPSVDYYLNCDNFIEYYKRTWRNVLVHDGMFDSLDNNKTLLSKNYLIGYNSSNGLRVRQYLLRSEFFHILDKYELSLQMFQNAQNEAIDKNIDFSNLLWDVQISEGHLHMHLNNLSKAIRLFGKTTGNPIEQSRDLFRLGECYVYQGMYEKAKQTFDESLEKIKSISIRLDQQNEVNQIRGDVYRKLGTCFRIQGDLKRCILNYHKAEEAYKSSNEPRGIVWLKHGLAEYYKSIAYNRKCNRIRSSSLYIKKSTEKFFDALHSSHSVLNINRVAHAKLGLLVLLRIDDYTLTKAILDEFRFIFKIYKSINSSWGIIVSRIVLSIYLYKNGKIKQAISQLECNRRITNIDNFQYENKLIQQILSYIKKNKDIDFEVRLTLF